MQSLENQFLIAMPSLADGYFNKTVTYICEHNEEGAMGLIINMPINITLQELLTQIETEGSGKNKTDSDSDSGNGGNHSNNQLDSQLDTQSIDDQPNDNALEQLVLSGGPISQNRGFVFTSYSTRLDKLISIK